MTLRLDHGSPVLPAFRYNRSLAFFKSIGFDVVEMHDRYAIMRAAGTSIHLQETADQRLSEGTTFRLYVDNVDVFYSVATARGALGLEPPREDPRGIRECVLQDPSGIRLMVAMRAKKKRLR